MHHYYTERCGDRPRVAIADVDQKNNRAWITRINTPADCRGQGFARMIMRRILDDADKENVILILEVASSGPMDYDTLVAWYERLGFTHESPFYMTRRPNVSSVQR